MAFCWSKSEKPKAERLTAVRLNRPIQHAKAEQLLDDIRAPGKLEDACRVSRPQRGDSFICSEQFAKPIDPGKNARASSRGSQEIRLSAKSYRSIIARTADTYDRCSAA